MTQPLARRTFYAYDKDTGAITEVTFSLGYPEEVREGLWRVLCRIEQDDGEGRETHGAGVDAWQALMIAISILKLRAELVFRKKRVSFHYTREAAEQQENEMALKDFFPKKYG